MDVGTATIDQTVRTRGAARLALRDATAQAHAAVDDVYSRFDLSRADDYRAFLSAQQAALAPLEATVTAAGADAVLPDWPARRRAAQLAQDLQALGGEGAAAPVDLDLRLTSPAAVLGAIYVLEGSRFGGAMLARRLPAGMPAAYLGAAAEPRSWRSLVAALDDHIRDERDLLEATVAAQAVFDAFSAAGRQEAR